MPAVGEGRNHLEVESRHLSDSEGLEKRKRNADGGHAVAILEQDGGVEDEGPQASCFGEARSRGIETRPGMRCIRGDDRFEAPPAAQMHQMYRMIMDASLRAVTSATEPDGPRGLQATHGLPDSGSCNARAGEDEEFHPSAPNCHAPRPPSALQKLEATFLHPYHTHHTTQQARQKQPPWAPQTGTGAQCSVPKDSRKLGSIRARHSYSNVPNITSLW
jgi:hypothetical protein